MELGDDDVRRGDTEGNALAVGLVADNTLDVDHPLETVDAEDLALTALVGATDNGDLVVLADGDRADLISTRIRIPVHDIVLQSGLKTHFCQAETGIKSTSKTYVVLLSEFGAEGGTEDHTALARGSTEVRLARLSARRGDG